MMIEARSLDPGEELLWSGKPDPIRFALKRGAVPVLIGIIFLVTWIPMFMVSRITRSTAGLPPSFEQITLPFDFSLLALGLMFGFVGLCGVLSPLWFRLRAIRTIYALTNRRVVIDIAHPRPRTLSIPLEHVRFIEVRAGAGGSGDVIFLESMRPGVDGWGPRGEGFIAIPDAAHVEQMLKTAIENTFATRTRKSSQ
jgi:hypothetical protein